MKFLPSNSKLHDNDKKESGEKPAFKIEADDDEDVYSNEFEASHRNTGKQEEPKTEKKESDGEDYEDDFD